MVDAARCEAMARGGIHDQLGGGFARYSVDADWVVPHFEKMLYDNALLLGLYADWGTPVGAWAAEGIADFLLGELRTREGGFASALDADSEGVEGTFYVWTPAQLAEVLGPDDGAVGGAGLSSVTEAGTFEHGSSTLQLREDPDDLERWLETSERRLRAAREHRERPARDDKVVAAWNGLAISGLCVAGGCSGATRVRRRRGRGRRAAAPAAPGRRAAAPGLPRRRRRRAGRACSRTTAASRPGFLDLLQATGDPVWLERAGALLDTALAHFRGRRRRLLRHRRRRRGAGRPAPRPSRQRQPVRAVRDGARARRRTPR